MLTDLGSSPEYPPPAPNEKLADLDTLSSSGLEYTPENEKLADLSNYFAVADLGGGEGHTLPRALKFFPFHTVFGKIWQNCMLALPWGIGAPWGNSGSAAALSFNGPDQKVQRELYVETNCCIPCGYHPVNTLA